MHILRVAIALLAMLLLTAPAVAQAEGEPPTAASDEGAETPAKPGEAAKPDQGGEGAEGETKAGDGDEAAPAAPKEPAAAPAKPGMDGQTYAVRLRDLQQRIDHLKEQIRRSHTRLSLLSDTILSGGGSGSRITISFENKLSSPSKLTRALVVLDGAVQYNKQDTSGALSEQKVIPVFSGSIPPGDHTVQVLVNLQGDGFGVFSYLRGYRFEVRSSHSFTAVEGKTTKLRILAYEKGGVTTPHEERPAVRYLEKVVQGLVDQGAKSSK